MGTTNESRISELEHPDPRQARGPHLFWIDGTDTHAADVPPGEPEPRMWATRAAAEAWWAQHEPTLDPVPEGELSSIWLDMNGDKSADEIRAGLQETTRRRDEHAAALERQQRETREELEERRELQ